MNCIDIVWPMFSASLTLALNYLGDEQRGAAHISFQYSCDRRPAAG